MIRKALTALAAVGGTWHGTQVHHRYREHHTQRWPRLALYAASAIHFGLGDAAEMKRPTARRALLAGVLPIAVPLLIERYSPKHATTAFLAYFALWHAPSQIIRHGAKGMGEHAVAMGLVHHIAESFVLDVEALRSP